MMLWNQKRNTWKSMEKRGSRVYAVEETATLDACVSVLHRSFYGTNMQTKHPRKVVIHGDSLNKSQLLGEWTPERIHDCTVSLNAEPFQCTMRSNSISIAEEEHALKL